jgi:hypothetical protein
MVLLEFFMKRFHTLGRVCQVLEPGGTCRVEPSPPSHPTPAAGQLVRAISPGVTKERHLVSKQDSLRSHLSLGDPNLY